VDPTILFIIIFLLAPLVERLLKARRQQQSGDDEPVRGRPGQRPLPRERPSRPWEESGAEPQVRAPAGEEISAAEMLPDDLWEILTGEKRQRPAPEPPRPEPPLPEREREESVARRQEPVVAPAPRPIENLPRRPEPATSTTAAGRRRAREQGSQRERRLPPVETRRLPPVEERRLPPVRMRRPAEHGPADARAGHRRGRQSAASAEPIEAAAIRNAPDVFSVEELDSEQRHSRFHDRLSRLDGPAVVQRGALHELAVRFNDRGELRRALVMSEVLGPPRALDPRRPGEPAAPPSA
jgi:hypothetical protein